MARHLTRPSATRCGGGAPLAPDRMTSRTEAQGQPGDGACTSPPVGGTSCATSAAIVGAGPAGAARLTSGSHPGLGRASAGRRIRRVRQQRSHPGSDACPLASAPAHAGHARKTHGRDARSSRSPCGSRAARLWTTERLWMTDSEIVGEAARFPAGEPRAPRGTEATTSPSDTGISDSPRPARRPRIRLNRRAHRPAPAPSFCGRAGRIAHIGSRSGSAISSHRSWVAICQPNWPGLTSRRPTR